MSRNADTVKSFYDAYNRRDWAALSAMMSPGVEWFHAPRGELMRGSEAVIALFKSTAETFPNARVQVKKLHEAGDFVITECSFARPHADGVEQAVFCEIEQFIDGKCVRGSTYADTFRMLEMGLAAA